MSRDRRSRLEIVAQKIRRDESVTVSKRELIEIQELALDIKDLALYDKVDLLLEIRP